LPILDPDHEHKKAKQLPADGQNEAIQQIKKKAATQNQAFLLIGRALNQTQKSHF
jgi:hypothetical protein